MAAGAFAGKMPRVLLDRSLFQAFVKPPQFIGHESSVFAHQLAIEINLATAVVGPLNQHEVPVHDAAVAVVGIFVGLARRKVQRAADLFVE